MISPYIFPGISTAEEKTAAGLKDLICDYFKITVQDFEGQKRDGELVTARHWYSFIQKKFNCQTFKQIGKECGGRDHSTIVNGVNTLTGWLSVDSKLRNEFRAFLRSVNYQWENKFEKIIAEKF